MNRRSFIGKTAIGGALIASLGLEGCSWESDLESVLPGILAAISSILSVLKSAGIAITSQAESIVADIQTGGGDIMALLQQWSPSAGNAATIVSEIDTLLTAFLSDFQNLLALLPPLPATIIGIVGSIAEIVLSTIEAYLAKAMPSVSLPKTQAKLQQVKVAVAGKTGVSSGNPKYRNGKSIAHDVNATGWWKLVK